MAPLPGSPDFATGFLTGVAAALILVTVIAVFFLCSGNMYDLDHWKLNIRTPLPSMWMNLGYWSGATFAMLPSCLSADTADRKSPSGKPIRHLDEACASLLRELLSTAGLLRQDDDNTSSPPDPLAILDLGIGCGDQTSEIVRLMVQQQGRQLGYVGLTLSPVQLQAAVQRLDRELAAAARADEKVQTGPINLFCTDAAKPHAWPGHVRSAVEALADKSFTERWLLAVDCLYHFSPSRRPIWNYATRKLGANVAAFDLLLNESSSWRDIIFARAVGVLMRCPWRTFLTEEEYREQLVASGYERESVIFRDVSEDVFPGLVGFLDSQDQSLAKYGISLGGGFRFARNLFNWFGTAKIIKAVIVVAHVNKDAA
ncbi:LPS-assembly protein LptD [Madurella mycetomatis]|uniref:LPS-assembly protein LptD n=1 Tax=Madurella mycetomatis TaxID=100816 RepID=A0A175VUV4_9PEZI|nr:LPS-assembly protein LptD [Madurella mycetomatis]KXX76211.1 LPS-assembly protein LptD [Madurella mycetomatis]